MMGNCGADFRRRNVEAANAVRPPVPVALPAMIAAVARHTGHITSSRSGLSLLHEEWRFVGARSPACGHWDIEQAQIHGELPSMLIPVAEHYVAQELRTRLGLNFAVPGKQP